MILEIFAFSCSSSLIETRILYKVRYFVLFVFFILVTVCEMRSLALILIEIIIGLAAFRFETQSKVWRSSLIFPGKNYIQRRNSFRCLTFEKIDLGKFASLSIRSLSLSVNWFGASGSKLGRNKIQIQNVFFNKKCFSHHWCFGLWWSLSALFLRNVQLMGTPMQLLRICLIKCITLELKVNEAKKIRNHTSIISWLSLSQHFCFCFLFVPIVSQNGWTREKCGEWRF